MHFLQLVVEALLYYLACSLLAKREEQPGFLRVMFVVLALAFVSGGMNAQDTRQLQDYSGGQCSNGPLHPCTRSRR